jgi:rRNA biogenesis protein RRP5
MTVGMKVLGQIISVQPLALIVSLPNQLLGHVPITQISTNLTHILENMDEDQEASEAESDDEQRQHRVPDLFEIFRPGQYVRAIVTAVHAAGSTDMTGIGRTRDETVKASRRVELSLAPDKVNDGVQKSDLRLGFVCSCQYSRVLLAFNFSHRRCQRPSRVLKTMDTFSIWGCPMYLDFCHSKKQRKGPLTTTQSCMLVG